jgi:GlpG protein
MRLIGTLKSENAAKRLSSYLKNKGIDSRFEISGASSYQLWILDEDKISSATADFERFQHEPSNAEFDAPIALQIEEEAEVEEVRGPAARRAPLTFGVILICALVFIYSSVEERAFQQEGLGNEFMMTRVQVALLYDVPPAIEALEEMIEEKKITAASEVDARVAEIEKMPAWKGVYDWVVLRLQGKDTTVAEGPLFYKIRQGEVWRLFSPCLLHGGFLHILFNMIWLWVLGRPIEQRIGLAKTALLTGVSGIGSNTIQYLVSGPFFIGYSGIVMALAGFIWMRQRVAPWEGYPLNRTTVLFLLLFVGSMAALTIASFFLQIFTSAAFAPNIANAAHIAGALIGAYLGRFSFFNQRAIV